MLNLINELNEYLIKLDTEIKNYALSHNYSITTYLENLSSKILSACFNANFININYVEMNTSGFDLLDKNSNQICQTTIEKVNKSKITKSIEKTENVGSYSKFYFFFLSYEDKKTYKISCPIDYEIVTLKTVFQYCEKNPQLAKKIYTILKLWLLENITISFDPFETLDDKFCHTLNNNKVLKKFIPDVYIEESNLKNYMRGFCNPEFAKNWVKLNLDFVPSSKVSDELNFWGYLDGVNFNIDDELNKENYDKIKQKISQIIELSKNLSERKLVVNNKKLIRDLTNTYLWGNSSIRIDLKSVIETIDIFSKKYMIIVKDAGQGKTNLLCDFVESYLKKLRIPYAFININETNDDIYEYFSRRLVELFSLSLEKGLRFINDYCKTLNLNFIIVLDGLNECNNTHNFYNKLKEFISLCSSYNNIKIIMSCRNFSYSEIFSQLVKITPIKDYVYTSIENKFGNNTYQKSEIFKDRILEAYLKFYNISIVLSDNVKKHLSDDTLLLRMFSEVYKNQSSGYIEQVNNYLIFKQYLELRAQDLTNLGVIPKREDLFNVLRKICNRMIKSKNFLNFSDDNFDLEEKRIINKIIDADIIIKKEKKNLLLSEYCYSFVYDEIRDFILADIITNLEFEEALKILEEIDLSNFDGIGRYVFIFSKIKNNVDIYKYISQNMNIFFNTIFDIDDRLINENDKGLVLGGFYNALSNNRNLSFFVYKLIFRCNSNNYRNLNISIITNEFVKDINSKLKDSLYSYNMLEYRNVGVLGEFLFEKNKYIDSNEIKNVFEFIFVISPLIPYEYDEIFQSLVKKIYKLNPKVLDEIFAKHNRLQKNINIIKEIIC